MLKSKDINFHKAKQNRSTSTAAEAILRYQLRRRKMLHLTLSRQHSIHRYIVDFFCYDLNLAIEAGGKYHPDIQQMKEDEKRTNFLNSRNIHFFRIPGKEVFYSAFALEKLTTFIEFIKAPSPAGEGGG